MFFKCHHYHFRIIESFGTVSGLKVLGFKTTKDTIKVLGTFLSYNKEKNIKEIFIQRIRRMKVKFNLWLSRDLTLYGKTVLAKSLGVSQLVYAASMLSVPTIIIKTVQSELSLFPWKNKNNKIKSAVIYEPFKEGGLQFINFG